MRALFCDDTDEETVAFLLERSGGNPFFVEELVAFVQETRDSGRVRELPATLHGLVAARLDALDAAERSLLEDCAVVGGSGSVAAVLRARRSEPMPVRSSTGWPNATSCCSKTTSSTSSRSSSARSRTAR